RKSKIIPNFIKNSTHCYKLFVSDCDKNIDIDRMLQRHTQYYLTKILSLLIKHKHNILRRANKQMEEATTTLKEQLGDEDLKQFIQNENNVANKLTTKLKKKQTTKFERLRTKRNMIFTHNNKQEDWFINNTNVQFPKEVKELLAKGPKFGVPVENKTFPLFQYIADGEDLVQTLENKEQIEEARTKLSLLIKSHSTRNKKSAIDSAISDTVAQTRKFLQKNKNIRILTSDKGNKTVAMEAEDYNNKMKCILNDLTTYRIQRQDPTSRLQTKNNTLVEKLFRTEIITKAEKKKLSTNTALPPRIYGLPKIHKEGIPLRPICSAVGLPAYGLCKYIAEILKNTTAASVYNVKNTLEFKERVNDTNISDNEKLISFDVVSFFPSIPIQLALDVIQEKWTTIKEFTKIPKQLFMEIVQFCIKDNRYFKFNDNVYTQLKGLPMGSPTSPVIADIVMEKLLEKTMDKLEHKPRLLTKYYVDDLFAIVEENEVENVLNTLNSFDKNIKFTVELEKDGKLAYLDAIVNRLNNKLKLKWYRKPTSSGRIINYNSKHPKSMILNTAMGCIKRMLQTSDQIYHNEIKKEIFTTLKNNDFPTYTIKKLLSRVNHAISQQKPQMSVIFKSLTYVPQLSERLAKSDCYNKEKIKIAHRPTNTLKYLFNNTKSKIPQNEKSNVVYQIPCKGSGREPCKSVYVGTTKLKLKSRLSQHKSDFKYCHTTDNPKTALMAHCSSSGHSPNFDDAKILQQERNYNKRFTLEMLHIVNTPSNIRLNFKSDSSDCAHIYKHLLTNKQYQTPRHTGQT
ncbi:uncharacterized protein, partial [Eurosta solidaginis]|uniref:uncharacterized protein n=1 Tax=Eurosta solidaginis TaxID=178769 RepID=UPI003530804E